MSGALAPALEDGVVEAILAARAANEPLLIQGRGTKAGMLRPVQAARALSTRNLTSVSLYSPQELIVSAGSGITISDLEAAAGGERTGHHRRAAEPRGAARNRGRTDAGRRGGHQPVRAAPGRLGRDAGPRDGRTRGEWRGRGDPVGRARAEERDGARPVQAADRQLWDACGHHRGDAQGAAAGRVDRVIAVRRAGCRAGRCGRFGGAGITLRRVGRCVAAGGGRGAGCRTLRDMAPWRWSASKILPKAWSIGWAG